MGQKLYIFMSKVFGFKKTTSSEHKLCMCIVEVKFCSFRHSFYTLSSVKLELATRLTRWCQIMSHLKRY